MRRFSAWFALTATIMLASSPAVNGEGVTFTETITPEQAKKGKALKDLVSALTERGQLGALATSVGPVIDLEDKAQIRFFSLRPRPPQWANRYCDIVYAMSRENLPPHPHCFVMIDKVVSGHDVHFTNFRFDLTGRLLNAAEARGKVDDEGKPVRASGKAVRLDVTDKKVREDAEKVLEFWLSGKYKAYLPAAPAEPAAGRK